MHLTSCCHPFFKSELAYVGIHFLGVVGSSYGRLYLWFIYACEDLNLLLMSDVSGFSDQFFDDDYF